MWMMLKDFDIPAKNPSVEAQKNWRNLVTPVKNKRRRFRYGPNFEKRSEAREKMEKLREKLQASNMQYMEELESIDVGDQLGLDLPHEWDGEAGLGIESQDDAEAEETVQGGTETECQNQASTAGSGI